MNQSSIARVVIIVAIILIGGGALTYALVGKKPADVTQSATVATSTSAPVQPTSASASGSATVSVAPTPSAPASTSVYKDGTYSATGSYISPGGDEKLGVTVTLKDDIVTAASVTPEPVSDEGQHYQGIFKANFQSLVVGKNIADVHLTTVSGSSLTPGGFDNALTQIEAEAKA